MTIIETVVVMGVEQGMRRCFSALRTRVDGPESDEQ